MPDGYAREDFFRGAHFSLSLELGFAGHDGRMAAALSALRACPGVRGPWADPSEIGRLDRRGFAPRADTGPSAFGLLTADASTRPVPFVLFSIREERAREPKPDPDSSGVKVRFGIQTQEPSDWLTLDIPVRMLAATWPVDGSWSAATQPWLADFCRVLADVAGHVHARAPLLGG